MKRTRTLLLWLALIVIRSLRFKNYKGSGAKCSSVPLFVALGKLDEVGGEWHEVAIARRSTACSNLCGS